MSAGVTQTITHGFSRNGEKLSRLSASQPVCGLQDSLLIENEAVGVNCSCR